MSIRDEYWGEPEEEWAKALSLRRLRMQTTYSGSWTIGERFDERFDTEVGGNQLGISQHLSAAGELQGGIPYNVKIQDFSAIPKIDRPALIVDYGDGGKSYTMDEAERLPLLAAVLMRLKERVVEYNSLREAP